MVAEEKKLVCDGVFQALEKRKASFSKPWKTSRPTLPMLGKSRRSGFQGLENRGGSALIVVMWVLLILALLVSSMVYDMHIEASLTAYQRNRTQAQQFARAGVEYARYLLWKSTNSDTC